jgi:hypothetical protein
MSPASIANVEIRTLLAEANAIDATLLSLEMLVAALAAVMEVLEEAPEAAAEVAVEDSPEAMATGLAPSMCPHLLFLRVRYTYSFFF